MGRVNKKRKLEGHNKVLRTFVDLPLMDLMSTIAQYLTPKDLFALRRCSRYFKQLVDDVGLPALGLVDLSGYGYGHTHDGDKHHDGTLTHEKNETKFASKRNIMLKCRNARLIKMNAKWLTNELLSDFLKNNPKLEAFELNSCSKILGKTLQPLLTFKNLVVLKMTNMKCGDDKFLRDLSQYNNQLLEIDFYRNTVISGKAIKEFVSKQPRLKSIGLPDMFESRLTESVIKMIIDACKNLESIKFVLHYDWEINDRVLIRLAKNCKKLKRITLTEDVSGGGFDDEDLLYENREVIVYLGVKGIEFYLDDDHSYKSLGLSVGHNTTRRLCNPGGWGASKQKKNPRRDLT